MEEFTIQGNGVNATCSTAVNGNWDWSNITITTYPYQYQYQEQSGGSYSAPQFKFTKEIDMKGNGKEFLVFAKGSTGPTKACESEAEALEEASALADKNDETYFIYKAIKRVSPVRTDLEVTEL